MALLPSPAGQHSAFRFKPSNSAPAAGMNGKDVKLNLDGDADSACIKTGKVSLKIETGGTPLKSDASVKISGSQGTDLDGS